MVRLELISASTYTPEGKRQYNMIFMRLSRSTSEQKQTISSLIQEILKLNLTVTKFQDDHDKRKTWNTPLPINPNFKLSENKLDVHLTKISPNIVGEPSHRAVEMIRVLVPTENKLDALIPFYRDIALELYGLYKNAVSLEQVENFVRSCQSLNLTQLQQTKKEFEKLKRDIIFLRITQEERKGIALMEESLGLTDIHVRFERLRPYLEDAESKKRLWLLSMNKLHAEGYEFFPAALVSNSLIHSFEDKPVNDDAKSIVVKETLCPSLKEGEDSEKMEAWRTRNLSDYYLMEKCYVDFRVEQIETDRKKELWFKEKTEWLRKVISENLSKDHVAWELAKEGCDRTQLEEVLRLYDEISAEPIRLKTRLIRREITVESSEDLQAEWLSCMAARSGAPDREGRLHEPENFDQSVERCTYIVMRTTGVPVKPETFEKAKKYWEPGYWYKKEEK